MHNYWLKNQTKMSKSIGNVIDPEAIIKKHGIDAVRFYFLTAGPLLHDVNFEEKTLLNIFYLEVMNTNNIWTQKMKYILIMIYKIY